MTRREQLTAILNGTAGDDFGSIFWKHFDPDEQLGASARQAHDDWIAATDPVFVKVMNEQLYPHGQEFQSAEDWAAVEPYTTEHKNFVGQRAFVKEMVEAYRDSHHVFATVHGVTASAFHARGGSTEYDDKRGQLVSALRKNEDLVGAKFAVIGESLVQQTRALMEVGVDGIFLAALGGESTNFTDDEFARHVRPYDLAVLEAVGEAGGLRYLHICKQGVVLDRYNGYPVEIVQVGEHLNDISLDGLRERFPDAVVVGGVDNMDPYFQQEVVSSTAAEALARRAVTAVSDHARFIVGADCSLPDATNPERVGALARAVHSNNR